MKNKTYLLLITVLLFISACRKSEAPDSKTSIRGHLLEYGTEAPLANVKIYLGSCEGGLLEPLYCSTIDSFYTDENGYFDYETNAESVDLCTFEPVDGYYPIGNYVINRGVNEFTQYADPEAWLELHVKNVDPVNGEDNIRISGSWAGGSPEDNFGTNIDFIKAEKVRGNRDTKINWWVTKQGTTTVFRDTILISSHDTVFYEILY